LPECNNDIRDQGLKEQLCLGSKGNVNKVNTNHSAGGHQTSSRVFHQYLKNECQNIVEEPATTQVKEMTMHSWNVRDVGAVATLGNLAHIYWKRRNGGMP
jgi:hypothetical protein